MSLVELCCLQAAAPCRDLTRISLCVVPQWLVCARADFPPVLQKALSLAHRCLWLPGTAGRGGWRGLCRVEPGTRAVLPEHEWRARGHLPRGAS